MAAPRRSVLALAVLSMLGEAPMHPYRMQQLVKERHKDDVVNVSQRGSLYQTVQRLERDGLVEAAATGREGGRPERTTYRLTDAGLRTLHRWLREMLAVPAREYPELPAALSFLASIGPEEALEALTERVGRLEQRLAALEAETAGARAFLPRLFLVESELQARVLAAELGYLRSLVDDLRSGGLTWPTPPPPPPHPTP